MALQDQTLANTQAKMGLEASRRRRVRNAAASAASLSPGTWRKPSELPWYAQQGQPGVGEARGLSEVPGWLRGLTGWFNDPAADRDLVVPGAAMANYAQQVASGQDPSLMQAAGAALDVPVPGAAAVKAGLSSLGGLMLGVAGKRAAAKSQRPVVRARGVHYSRNPNLTEIDPAFAGEGLDMTRRAQEARSGSTRPRETFLYTEGSELAGKPEVGLGPYQYRTTGEVEVYDFNKDPLGLKQKHRGAWKARYGDKPWMGEAPEVEVREAALNDLKEMGYQGYVEQGTGIIGMFEPTPVRRAETGPRAWLENVATVADLPTTPQPGARGPDYLRAFERRKVKGKTEFIGAPPGVRAPKDIEARVQKYQQNVEDALDAGVPPGYFYQQGTDVIERVTEDPEMASAFARLIGITSSQAPVVGNVDWAIRGMDQAAMGLPITTGMTPNKMRPEIEAVLQGLAEDIGVKRGRYASGLMGGQAKGQDVLAPNDRWEARTAGFTNTEGGISPENARFIDRVRQEAIRRVNEKRGLNLRPLEGQELNWITERTRGTSSAGAMAVPTVDWPTGTVQGALAGRTFQHSWETAPGAKAQHFEGMSPSQADAHRAAVEGVVLDPETGKDRLVSAMGGMQFPALRGPGVWGDQVTPGVQSRSLVSATTQGLHPSSEARVKGTEAVRALALGQEAYAGSMMTPGAFKPENADMLGVNLGSTVDNPTALKVQQALNAEFGPGNTTLVPTERGFNILDTTEEGIPDFGERIAQFGKRDNLGPLTGVPEVESTRARYGPTSMYKELPWEEGQATASVLQTLQSAPGLQRRADSPQTRELMGDVTQVYENLRDQGIMPNEKLLNTLRVWQKEGLEGVKRLVQQGLAPVAILGVLGAQQMGPERTTGGQTGAPAASGLPELGV